MPLKFMTMPPMRDTLAGILRDPLFRKLCFRGAIALYALIVIGGSLPGAREDIGEYASGLILHSLAYAVLGFLLFAGTLGGERTRAAKTVLTVALMGAFDEYVQSFFPYRTASLGDWLVDVGAGIVVSTLLWAFWPPPDEAG
jgi:VanZ family protein